MSRNLAAAVVASVSLALYLPALRNGFAYDDVVVIVQDARVHSIDGAGALLTQSYWMDPELGLYRPLVSLSFLLDWVISDGSPVWFHAVNAVWNALACVALFGLLATLAPVLPALAGALLFAVHPVHVEAVANVVGRAELMAAAFSFAALWLWCRQRAPTRGTALAVALLYALALASKESAIMLPALLALVDAGRGTLRPANWREWLRAVAPALAVLVLVAAVYLLIRTLVLGDVGPGRLDPALEVGSPLQQRLTALQAWPITLRVLLVPWLLLADYGPRIIMPADTPTTAALLGILILLALIGGGVAVWLRGRGIAALALLWLPITLLPVSNLIIPIGIVLAERALYLPSAALAFGVIATAPLLAGARVRRLAGAGAAVIVVLFSARSLLRIPDWTSTNAIMAAQLRDRPDSFRAQWHVARLTAARGDQAAAVREYARALDLWPYRRGLLLEAANVATRAGNLDFAQRIAQHMLTRWPDDLDATRLLAGATLDRGDTAAARALIARGLRIDPDDPLLLRMRAAVSDSLP